MKKTLAIVLVVVALATMMVACGVKSNSIIGTWEMTQDEQTVSFTFEDGGKGKMDMMGMSVDTTWEIKDGKLTISASVMGVEQVAVDGADYKVDGNKLSITYEGETLELTKK